MHIADLEAQKRKREVEDIGRDITFHVRRMSLQRGT